MYVVYNYCIPFIVSNTQQLQLLLKRGKPNQPYSTYTFLFRASISLQLTSILPVTCFVAVLWPELWLQQKSENYGRHCCGDNMHAESKPYTLLFQVFIYSEAKKMYLCSCSNNIIKLNMYQFIFLAPAQLEMAFSGHARHCPPHFC